MIKNEAILALNILNKHGFEAYIVGGAVRDYLLNKDINDYDITTNAKPLKIEEVFKDYKCFNINKRFGTITVMINHIPLEITTYRGQELYDDHRKPSSLNFISDIKEDVMRRDFTINCLLIDKDLNIIDYVDGQKDLNNKVIKTIGEADKRFSEDALRILRAIRFKAQLNFEIEEKTRLAIFKNANLLKHISMERKRDELFKILVTNHKTILNEYQEVINLCFPYQDNNPLIYKTDNLLLKLYLLNKDANFKALKLSRDSLKQIYEFKTYDNTTNLNELLSNTKYLDNFFEYHLLVHNVDYHQYYKDHKEYIISLEELEIKGQDLIELGYSDRAIGLKLKEILKLIHEEKLVNDKKLILNYLKTN